MILLCDFSQRRGAHSASLHQVVSLVGLTGFQDLRGLILQCLSSEELLGSLQRVSLIEGAVRISQLFSGLCVVLAGEGRCMLMNHRGLDEGAWVYDCLL